MTPIWCDVSTDPGHSWRVKAVKTEPYSTIEDLRQVCEAHGFANIGRGVARVESWLVAKRYLHDSGVGASIGWTTASSAFAMPIWQHSTNIVKTIERGNEIDIVRPNNLVGDSCNADQKLCGYWYSDGWVNNDFDYPDPEDWGPENWGSESRIICMQDDSPPTCSAATSNGARSVSVSGVSQEVWCDVATDPGHAWKLKAFKVPSSSVSSPEAMRTFCLSQGFPKVGKGVERQEAWLVAKRYLHDSGVGSNEIGFSDASAAMAMPIWQHSTDVVKTIEAGVEALISRPVNLQGDHCNANQVMCGYWYYAGWKDNDMSYPDPEDWGVENWGSNSMLLCMEDEA